MTPFLRSTLLTALALAVTAFAAAPSVHAQEKVMGTEIIDPGIQIEVIAAPKDAVTPSEKNLPEAKTDVHLEVLATWASDESVEVPSGATRGGFVGFLHLFARVTNERTGRSMEVTLAPHINLSDNLHYARNISLPGAADDPYTVTLFVEPPQKLEMSYHTDWRETYGSSLFEPQSFEYTGVQLADVAAATR